MPTIETIINDVIRREGAATNDPADNGGRTEFGISEKANPEAWKDNKVTEAEAREIYLKKYVTGPGFDKITDKLLQAQLVDYGVNSGPYLAVMKLQEILHVDVDGVLGPQTLAAIQGITPSELNNLLVSARIKMIGKIVSKNPSQLKFLNGWLNRALEFID
jgi:lysozyme family protein